MILKSRLSGVRVPKAPSLPYANTADYHLKKAEYALAFGVAAL
ncbi:hypothetical protein IMSAGC008_00180 [Muribaculaceae bacterium]|nr:hypothetical protein IMSAGC008_00180 [Muribaculaceae bacterium]